MKVEERNNVQIRQIENKHYGDRSKPAAAAKLLQSCPTLCGPIDGSPPGSPIPGILQARTLEWVAISFSNAWKWKWSCLAMSDPQRPHGLQPTRLLRPWDFPSKSTGVGCQCLLREVSLLISITTFHINDLNTPSKRDHQIGLKKSRTNYMLTTWNILIETHQGKIIP